MAACLELAHELETCATEPTLPTGCDPKHVGGPEDARFARSRRWDPGRDRRRQAGGVRSHQPTAVGSDHAAQQPPTAGGDAVLEVTGGQDARDLRLLWPASTTFSSDDIYFFRS